MENNPNTATNQPVDYLASLEDQAFQLTHATTAQRFLNFIIDNILMNYGLSFLTGAVVGGLLGAISPETLTAAVSQENVWSSLWLSLSIGYFNYVVYYTLCEKLFKGKTLGKLITGTRAVRLDGTELNFKDSLLRSLCRIVPFEAFSAFGGHPWHDTWTDTMVIKSK